MQSGWFGRNNNHGASRDPWDVEREPPGSATGMGPRGRDGDGLGLPQSRGGRKSPVRGSRTPNPPQCPGIACEPQKFHKSNGAHGGSSSYQGQRAKQVEGK